ncbi:hypothetical protein LTS15_007694 [Exophiala xenobiotica]|nr:hypothetical protein LTS15_007694 [Exophiala xenobiotica]
MSACRVFRSISWLARPAVLTFRRSNTSIESLALGCQLSQQRSFASTSTSRRHSTSTGAAQHDFTHEETSYEPVEDDQGFGRIRWSLRRRPGDGAEIAQVWICNARRANSVGSALLRSLTKVLAQLASRERLRVVVLSSEGPAGTTGTTNSATATATATPTFCGGANVREMGAIGSPEDARRFITAVHDACKALRDMPVLTVASIHGLTLGAGVELVASCDFRYATKVSAFSMPEVVLGIPSVVQARLLANIIGWQRTKEMVYFARRIDAQTAARWGLVDAVYDTAEELDAASVELTTKTIVAMGPQAMRAQKRLVKIWEETDLQGGVEAGIDEFANMWKDGGSEPKKYMRPFLQRR